MKQCIGVDKEYDENTHFVTYTVENPQGDRSYIMQFVRGDDGAEQFHRYSLRDPMPHSGVERDFERQFRIMNLDGVTNILALEGNTFVCNIVPKRYLLETINNSFGLLDIVRSNSIKKALDRFTQPFSQATGIDLNPVELGLTFVELITIKKVENRCTIS